MSAWKNLIGINKRMKAEGRRRLWFSEVAASGLWPPSRVNWSGVLIETRKQPLVRLIASLTQRHPPQQALNSAICSRQKMFVFIREHFDKNKKKVKGKGEFIFL